MANITMSDLSRRLTIHDLLKPNNVYDGDPQSVAGGLWGNRAALQRSANELIREIITSTEQLEGTLKHIADHNETLKKLGEEW